MLDFFFNPQPREKDSDVYRKWWIEKRDDLAEIARILAPFETIGGPGNEAEQDTPVQLARNARDLLVSDTRIIQQLTRDNEALLNQLGQANVARLEGALEEAKEIIEMWKDRALYWREKADKLQKEEGPPDVS